MKKYNLVAELASAPTRLSFGLLLTKDAKYVLTFDAIISCPTMAKLGTCIYFGNQSVSDLIDGIIVKMPLNFDKNIHPKDTRKTDSENFTFS